MNNSILFKAAHEMTRTLVENTDANYQATFGLVLSFLYNNKKENTMNPAEKIFNLVAEKGMLTITKWEAFFKGDFIENGSELDCEIRDFDAECSKNKTYGYDANFNAYTSIEVIKNKIEIVFKTNYKNGTYTIKK